jgi:hypothetical protein
MMKLRNWTRSICTTRFTHDEIVGKLGQTSTDFEVKQRKSARMVGIDPKDAGETAPHLGYQHGMVEIPHWRSDENL